MGCLAYMQGLTGYYNQLEFPYLNSLGSAGQIVSIESATLYLYPLARSYNEVSQLPNDIRLYITDENNVLEDYVYGSDGVTVQTGDLTIDYDKHHVLMRGEDVHLTLNEFKIVALLGRHAGQVLTYKSMMKELWGPGVGGDNKLLRVHMANIRRKIEKNPAAPEYIFTEIGVGYRMLENE